MQPPWPLGVYIFDSKSIQFTIHNSMVVNLIQQHFYFQLKMIKLNLKW